MWTVISWVMTTCNLVGGYQRFGEMNRPKRLSTWFPPNFLKKTYENALEAIAVTDYAIRKPTIK